MGIKWINNRPYYYTPVWEDGRALHVYNGSALSEQGRLALQLDRLMRAEREAARVAEDAEIRRIVADDRRVGRWCDLVEMAYQTTLEAAGFHRQGRHRWRRRRMGKDLQTTSQAPPPAKSWTHAEVQRVSRRAEKGDSKAEAEFRAILKSDRWHHLVDMLGNPARVAEDMLIHALAGPDGRARTAAMEERANELHRALLPADAHPLETLLVDRIVVCWLSAHVAEIRALTGAHEPRVYRAMQRAVDGAHRRLMSSVRALRDFRRLDVQALALVRVGVKATVQQGADR